MRFEIQITDFQHLLLALRKIASLHIFGLLVVLSFLISSCHPQESRTDFVLQPSPPTERTFTASVQVDNCDGLLPKVEGLDTFYSEGSLGVTNLQPNGGEPFTTIRQEIIRVHGETSDHTYLLAPLFVPPGIERTFEILINQVTYTGNITGEIIDLNKMPGAIDVTYYYPVTNRIAILGYSDSLCQP